MPKNKQDKKNVEVVKKVVTTVVTTEETVEHKKVDKKQPKQKSKPVKNTKSEVNASKESKEVDSNKSDDNVISKENSLKAPKKAKNKTTAPNATVEEKNVVENKHKKHKLKRIYVVAFKDKKTKEFAGFKLKKSFHSQEISFLDEAEVEKFINEINEELMVFVQGRDNKWARVYSIYKKDDKLVKDVKVIEGNESIHHFIKEFNPELDSVKVKKPVMFMVGMLLIVIALIVLFIMIGLFIWGKAGF